MRHVVCLHAADATQALIAIPDVSYVRVRKRTSSTLLSSCLSVYGGDSHLRGVCVFLLEKPVIQLTRDELALVIQVVDIPRASVGDSHDRPIKWYLRCDEMDIS